MLTLSLFLLAMITPLERTSVRHVSAGEARQLQVSGTAVLIDVRGSVPYELGHIRDAVWMPLGLVNQRAGELPQDKLIIAYCTCKSEEVSIETALALKKLGFNDVAVLRGGYPAWVEAKYPVETSSGEPVGSTQATSSAGRRPAPPAGVSCNRNNLTSFAGEVTRYKRARGKTTLTMRTDDGTTERLTIVHPPRAEDPSRWYLINGTPVMKGDLARIEASKGKLRPGMRAVAWVCSGNGRTTVDWQP